MEDWEEIIKTGADGLRTNPELFVKFTKLYKQIFGSDICLTCPGGFASAWGAFEATYKKNIYKMSKSKTPGLFVFKKNHLIYSTKSHSHFGAANITDEIAINLLRENRAFLQHFEKYPDNWEALVEGKKEETPEIKTPEPPAVNTPDEGKKEEATYGNTNTGSGASPDKQKSRKRQAVAK